PIEQLPARRTPELVAALTSDYATALAIAGIYTIAFDWLADEVLEKEFVKINTTILVSIHAWETPTLDRIALLITSLGSGYGITSIGLALAAALIISKRYVDLATLVAVLIGASLIVFSFKLFFHQSRPQVFTQLAPEHDYSFPSGH